MSTNSVTQTTQSVTLQTAVLMQVKEFAKQNRSFSVHDVTVAIRNKTRNGELEIPEVEVTGASFRFDIPHSKVKALFDEMRDRGVFNPDFRLDRQFTGMYFVYTPVSLQNTSIPSTSPTPSWQAGFFSQTPTPAPVQQTAAPVAKISVQEVTDRIEGYLQKCAQRNFRPTLKQVQSAIKRGNGSTRYSCEEIKDIIVDSLDYNLANNPENICETQVAVV